MASSPNTPWRRFERFMYGEKMDRWIDSWWPVCIFLAVLVLAAVGVAYGFANLFSSVQDLAIRR